MSTQLRDCIEDDTMLPRRYVPTEWGVGTENNWNNSEYRAKHFFGCWFFLMITVNILYSDIRYNDTTYYNDNSNGTIPWRKDI